MNREEYRTKSGTDGGRKSEEPFKIACGVMCINEHKAK